MTQTQFFMLMSLIYFGFGSTKIDALKLGKNPPPSFLARLFVLALWPLWTLFANKNEH